MYLQFLTQLFLFMMFLLHIWRSKLGQWCLCVEEKETKASQSCQL